MSVSAVVKHCNMLGEGPHWEEATQSLLYVDILTGELHRWNSITDEDTKLKFDDPVSFVIPRHGGGYLISLKRKICQLDWNTAKTTVVGEVPLIGKDDRLNDAKCDPSGRLWLGTMGGELKVEEGIKPKSAFELGVGALYSFDKDHKLQAKMDRVGISNGLAWSLDQSTMYYIDTIPRKVYAFDFDAQTGNISNQRVAVDYRDHTVSTRGNPDGMCIDNEGKLWVACFGGGKVIRFDPETGKNIQEVDIPASNITSCCFGGKNYDELYVTSARWRVSDEAFATTQQLAGSVFKVTGLGVTGSPAPLFQDRVANI